MSRVRSPVVLFVLIVAACPHHGGESSVGTSSGSGGTVTETTGGADTLTGSMSEATTIPTGTGSDTTDGSTSSTSGLPPPCDDGVAGIMEWCYQLEKFSEIHPRTLADAVDVDGDGLVEAIVWSHTGLWLVDQNLEPKWTTDLPFTPGSYARVQVGDFEGDGWADVFLWGQGSTVSVIHNELGVLEPIVEDFPVEYPIQHLEIMDVDGDGESEYFGLYATDAYLHGRGDEGLEIVQVYSDLVPCQWISQMRSADLNDDGREDVAFRILGCENENKDDLPVFVLLGQESGVLSVDAQYATGGGEGTLQIGDVDGDGFLDLVVLNPGTMDFSVLHGWGDGTFDSQVLHSYSGFVGHHAVGRFDGSPVDNIIFSGASELWVDSFTNIWYEPVAEYSGFWYYPAEINGDGVDDIIFGLPEDNGIDLSLAILFSKP